MSEQTPFEPVTYTAHWQKPEWIYHQVLEVKKMAELPDMKELRQQKRAVYLQKMGQSFKEFFDHYPKIFMRACEGTLNDQMLLMLLKKKKNIDEGREGFNKANDEVIGSAFSLMARKLPEDLRGKIMNTYKDLVEEKNAMERKAIEEYLEEQKQQKEQKEEDFVTGVAVANVDADLDLDDETLELQKIRQQENEAKEREENVKQMMQIVENAYSHEQPIVINDAPTTGSLLHVSKDPETTK
jgi:hypothetical protein